MNNPYEERFHAWDAGYKEGCNATLDTAKSLQRLDDCELWEDGYRTGYKDGSNSVPHITKDQVSQYLRELSNSMLRNEDHAHAVELEVAISIIREHGE